MSAATIISPDVANNRRVESSAVSPSAAERRELLIMAAAQAQIECRRNTLDNHRVAGELAAEALADSAATVNVDPTKAVQATMDAIIAESRDGRSTQNRRNELKKQVHLAALNDLVNISDLLTAHAFMLVGYACDWDKSRGVASVKLDNLQAVREVLAAHRKSPMDIKSMRKSIRRALGLPDKASDTESSLLESLRQVLADESLADERRAELVARHPQLSPAYVDPAEVTLAVHELAKLTQASRVEAITKSLLNSPDLAVAVMLALQTAQSQSEPTAEVAADKTE